jgi:hypothetical protein
VQTTMRYVDVSEADKRDAIASVFGARGSHTAAECDVAELTANDVFEVPPGFEPGMMTLQVIALPLGDGTMAEGLGVEPGRSCGISRSRRAWRPTAT